MGQLECWQTEQARYLDRSVRGMGSLAVGIVYIIAPTTRLTHRYLPGYLPGESRYLSLDPLPLLASSSSRSLSSSSSSLPSLPGRMKACLHVCTLPTPNPPTNQPFRPPMHDPSPPLARLHSPSSSLHPPCLALLGLPPSLSAHIPSTLYAYLASYTRFVM
ncbi:hypothetical protein GGS23DRAFT_484680 [Durotheca rogersii]|uniref:uncharacterized protein n=1 Tax=Durotheca rogersii TaxID=419775 RepID=UPI00222087E2|nr:uncharacterized protein GGS23DRAFT_484680 [Durotheca rogersii]KAI5864151.1 hypothetical protein GGS23DRAFT_484680 [Durotheca rogersii]